MYYSIPDISTAIKPSLQQKINLKTKPLGALGLLEEVALQIGLIQNTLEPKLINPHILVFAGDHGIAHEGVSAYPQDVTWQMVMNFLTGGAAINVFCNQHAITLAVVDAGVNHNFDSQLPIHHQKIGYGTKNFLHEPAMSLDEAEKCLTAGTALVNAVADTGCNIIGFGEMGIANTSSAAILMSLLCNIPLGQCVGRGTGVSDVQLKHKISVLETALQKNGSPASPLEILATYGGFEIAQMVGGMLQAATRGMVVLVDGFIATAAYLVAQAIAPAIRSYAIFCHQSDEHGHQQIIQHLQVKPLLSLGMRLGEGTGVAMAYPLIQSAVKFMNEMASFEAAGVSTKQ